MTPLSTGMAAFLEPAVAALVGATHALLAAGAAQGVLPPAFSHAFMAHALLAVLLVTPLFGALSVVVTARRLAFFSAALGQTALVGTAVGLWLGEPIESPWAGLLGTTLLFALALAWLRRHGRLAADTLTGVALALSLALGVAVLVVVTRRFNVHQVEGALFGNPLTVTVPQLTVLALLAGAVAASLALVFRPALLGGLDAGLAAATHGARRAAVVDYAFVLVLAVAVVVALPVVGALLVEGLVVVPAAAARLFGQGLRRVLWGSCALATAAGVLGLWISAVSAVPTGAAIVLVLGVFFVVGQLRDLLGRR